jgi:hypothetical protein
MKKVLEAIILFLILNLLVYLMVAFIAWDFNPSNWGMDSRALIAFMWLVLGGGLVANYFIFKDGNK